MRQNHRSLLQLFYFMLLLLLLNLISQLSGQLQVVFGSMCATEQSFQFLETIGISCAGR